MQVGDKIPIGKVNIAGQRIVKAKYTESIARHDPVLLRETPVTLVGPEGVVWEEDGEYYHFGHDRFGVGLPYSLVSYYPESGYIVEVQIYKQNGRVFEYLTTLDIAIPENYDEVYLTEAEFSPNNEYLAISLGAYDDTAGVTREFVRVYHRSGDTFTRLNTFDNLPLDSLHNYDFIFSPDGEHMWLEDVERLGGGMADRTYKLYKCASGTLTYLSEIGPIEGELDLWPVYSPDGTCLTFLSDADGYGAVPTEDSYLYTRSGDVYTEVSLSTLIGAYDLYSVIEINGKYVLMVGANSSEPEDVYPYITYIISCSGGTFTVVDTIPMEYPIVISSDGKFLITEQYTEPDYTLICKLYCLGPSGYEYIEQLMPPEGYYFDNWGPWFYEPPDGNYYFLTYLGSDEYYGTQGLFHISENGASFLDLPPDGPTLEDYPEIIPVPDMDMVVLRKRDWVYFCKISPQGLTLLAALDLFTLGGYDYDDIRLGSYVSNGTFVCKFEAYIYDGFFMLTILPEGITAEKSANDLGELIGTVGAGYAKETGEADEEHDVVVLWEGEIPACTGGDAGEADVLTGKTFTNDAGEKTGTMPNRGAVVITPGTSQQTIEEGYHNGQGYVEGDANLVAGNIKKDVTIFGVTGTLQEGIVNLVGTVSFSGTYAANLSGRTWAAACNANGQVLLVLQGANSTSYENIRFNLVSAPTGVTLLSNYTGDFDTTDPVGGMFGCIIQGVTEPIDIEIAVNTRDSTYDFYQADLTITLAE